ncbi:MAG: rhodanese-like domain-containing protein [Solirubrobacterales bacterium]
MDRDPITVEELLAAAREGIDRYAPEETAAALRGGAILIDIRPQEQIERDGAVPGATVVARNVAEWRLDPEGEHRNADLARRDREIIVICDEGYQSSLVAANLVRLGLRAGDVIGGVQEWRQRGLPLSREPSARVA